ncbi:MAG: dipeptidase [Candidatus Aminicenantes bacterium]|jgi:membrane dipeptidase
MKKIASNAIVSILSFSFLGIVCCAPKLDPEALEAESLAIHDRVLTVDTHCDTTYRLLSDDWDIGERHEPGERGSGKVDLPRMAEGGLDAEFFAVFVGQGERTPEGYARAKERAVKQLEGLHRMCEKYPHLVGLATSPEDAYRLEKEGKRAAYIGMENGYPIGRDLSLVEEYYKKGVRYITLCHGGDNDICDSSTERNNPEDNGLSDFGKEVVAECNRLGIMIDISHASDETFFNVMETSKAPIIASHSSVRALCDHPRNLTDKMIKALAADGGVIQICFVSSFVKTPKPNPERDKALRALREKYGPRREIKDEAVLKKRREEYMAVYEMYPRDRATVKDLVDHIDHVVKLVGVDHVGIGTDFDGGGDLEGCSDVSELPNVTVELVRRGYSEEEIRKIWGENLMRVFRAVIAVAQHTQN